MTQRWDLQARWQISLGTTQHSTHASGRGGHGHWGSASLSFDIDPHLALPSWTSATAVAVLAREDHKLALHLLYASAYMGTGEVPTRPNTHSPYTFSTRLLLPPSPWLTTWPGCL